MKEFREKETDIVKAILEYLSWKHVFHYRNNTGALPGGSDGKHFIRFGTPGAPDIICVISGRYVAIEVKTEKGVQSQKQFDFQTNLNNAGGIYFLVRSLAQAIEAIEDCITRLRTME